MATGIAKWLKKIAEALENKLLPFEAGDTWDQVEFFEEFVVSDGSSEGFGKLWQGLQDWGETVIVSGNREKSLCDIPSIPRLLEY